MKHMPFPLMVAVAGTAVAAPSLAPRTAERLASGQETRIVAFGDSITGVYYHSGSRRAWPEMLRIALRRLHPEATVAVFNAGISGHTTDQGLERIRRDVLAREPHLVVVKFGMNDLAYGDVDAGTDTARRRRFAANLDAIVEQCRGAGAEVILCTPNSVYPEAAPQRPPARLGEFAGIAIERGKALGVPVVDVHGRWERIRREDPSRWRLLMSETIHPSMAGHKCIAQWVAHAVCGREISLADEPPPPLAAARFVERLRAGRPATAVVCEPLAEAFRKVVLERHPGAEVTVVPWPVQGRDLGAIESWAKGIRARNLDLAVVSLPPSALSIGTEEGYVRRASWVVNWSLPFGPGGWTAIGVATSAWHPDLATEQRRGERIFGEVVAAHDLPWLAGSSPEALFRQWLAEQEAVAAR